MSVFRSPERDDAIDRLLAARLGAETWRVASLREAVDPDADLLFPGGPVEMIETWLDLGDRRMAEAAAREGVPALPGLSGRVRALVLLRLEIDAADPDAQRRAFAILSLPANAGSGARFLARTVDAIWRAAGDRSADFSWYTKRAILAGVYGATALFAMQPGRGPDEIEAFLDRRLAGTARLGRLRARFNRGRAA